MTSRSRHEQRFPKSSDAAALILPHLFAVAGSFETALDVGGGTGEWCTVLKRLGVSGIRCIDHPDVRPEELLIDPADFIACDMTKEFPSPRSFDLVLCLEFAEHLPPARSEPLIDFVTACGDVVLFSAAIPGQPSPHHVNEQPAEYWRELFARRGFGRFDCVRPLITGNARLPYWYRQNLYVFAAPSAARKRQLRSIPFVEIPSDFELVHSRVLQQYRTGSRPKVADIPGILKRSLEARLNRV